MVRFLAVGDWGRDGKEGQSEVAAAMGAWADAQPAAFVVSTGDNFYNFGVSGVRDRKWRTSFEEIYTQKSLQIPWYVALGNHDERGSVQAQIDYSAKSPRWRMPARNFTVVEPERGPPLLQLFVLDTSPFLSTYRGLFSLTRVSGQDPARTRDWLEKELAASTAPWKIVVGHHPVYSCGVHGDSPELVRAIVPLLERYRVPLYVNGHDHSLEHLFVGGIHYVTSGAGSRLTKVRPDPRAVFARSTNGFFAFTVSADALEGKAIAVDGRVLSTFTLTR
ncbi:MAG: purple acid phosphatase family protein [Thermoanaerobaculia bacterium]